MADLLLRNFPDSLLERVDRFKLLLEELNPGREWTRTNAISTLLVRALAQVEGAELRWTRRRAGEPPEGCKAAPERREGPAERRLRSRDRRTAHYPEMVDLVIEHILKQRYGVGAGNGVEDETWRDHHDEDSS